MRLTTNVSRVVVYLALVPTILYITLFWVIPILHVFIVSLTYRDSFIMGAPRFVGFTNYARVFSEYVRCIENSIKLPLAAAIVDLILGYPLAYILARRKVLFHNVLRASLIFPYFGDLYVSYGLWNMFLPGGIFDFVYKLLGVSYRQVLYTPYAVIAGFSIFTLPFMVLYVSSSLQEIDPTIEEAALTLGATPIKAFFKVIFPLTLHGAIAGFLACFGWNLGGYLIPLLLGGMRAGDVMTVKIVHLALHVHDYGVAAALSVILISMTILITFMTFKVTGMLR